MSKEDQRAGELDPSDAEIEREIRSKRRFSLSEAIARAGGELLKGASPVTFKRQAEIEIELFLERHLRDGEGALRMVLERRVVESEALLAAGYQQPLAALARTVEKILGSESRFERFVRTVDAAWGRLYSERPHFERDGRPPDREDPYTLASVRRDLSELLDRCREMTDK